MDAKKNDDRKNIVIVGGGGGGSQVARALSAKLDSSKYNLILINPRPYYILLPATARLAVSEIDHLEDRAFVPYDRVFHNGNGTFLQGKVTSIKKVDPGQRGGEVTLDSGERIPYEFLVLAPGAIWPGPLAFPDDKDDVSKFIREGRAALKGASDIVLVGGGAVGIEFAGEIKDIWPNKKVTIVQGDDALLNKAYPLKFRKALEKNLVDRGVELVLNDYVDEVPLGGYKEVKTRTGKTVKADLVLTTRGPRPNTGFIASSLGADTLTDTGLIRVGPTLQLAAYPDIYALGDVLDWPEQKQAAKAANHASIVSANILSSVDNKGRKLKEYSGSIEMIAVTNGKAGGVGYFDVLWGIVLGNWFVRLVKSKTLMVDQMRAAVGF